MECYGLDLGTLVDVAYAIRLEQYDATILALVAAGQLEPTELGELREAFEDAMTAAPTKVTGSSLSLEQRQLREALGVS